MAIVLAGAATKGGFEAGALRVIAERGIGMRRFVAASSGALNATGMAAAVRARREKVAAGELVRLWEERASLKDVLSPSLRGILTGRGISDSKKLYALLRDNIPPSRIEDPAPVDLHLIVAPLHGTRAATDGEPAVSFTRVLSFAGTSFDTSERLAEVIHAATASAALPILFEPVELPGLGACVDGGIVANTPIRWAFGDDAGASLDAIVVIAPTPSLLGPHPGPFRWLHLGGHIIDMLFSEWMFEDLRESRRHEESREGLAALAAREGWSPDELARVQEALDWVPRRPIPILSIRPVVPLRGSLLSGFKSRAIRREYIDAGIRRAEEILDAAGWR